MGRFMTCTAAKYQVAINTFCQHFCPCSSCATVYGILHSSIIYLIHFALISCDTHCMQCVHIYCKCSIVFQHTCSIFWIKTKGKKQEGFLNTWNNSEIPVGRKVLGRMQLCERKELKLLLNGIFILCDTYIEFLSRYHRYPTGTRSRVWTPPSQLGFLCVVFWSYTDVWD